MSRLPWLLSLSLLFTVSVSADVQLKVTNNPADQLVDVVNSNRTASKRSSLYDNPGLACIALQYIKAYQGDCDAVGGAHAKKPPEADFVEIFAPNCGVQTSTLSPITGRLLGCETKYVSPSAAFSEILMQNEKSIEILTGKNHTEVGAAVSGSDGGSPYFWCVLFSNGTSNSSFVLEGGVAKISRPGCFSGANDDCNSAYPSRVHHLAKLVSRRGDKAIAKISMKSSSSGQAAKLINSASSLSSFVDLRSMNSGEATATITSPMATSLSYDENLLLREETVDPSSMEETSRVVS